MNILKSKHNNTTGYFITIEGIEGVGKTTAIRFIEGLLLDAQIAHIITREPGGTPIAEKIRQLLLAHHEETIANDTELLLMFASRAQHLAKVIKPALDNNKYVICDRFTDASYAYQGGGRGILLSRIEQLENWVQGDLRPDLVLLLDAPADIGLTRMKNRSAEDRIESEKIQFFARVRQLYLQRAHANPERYKIIDASQSIENVEHQLCEILTPFLNARHFHA
jgi:dTMP kinase